MKELLTDLNAVTYAGSKVYLTQDNIKEIHIKSIDSNPDGTKNVESTFDVNTEYMVYHNDDDYLESQLQRIGLETTGKIHKAIDEYVKENPNRLKELGLLK